MNQELKKTYIEFIHKQLSEMAKNVKEQSSKNQSKRENNIFLIFSDKNAKKYMGTGRSFDSQLGTRLQKIAFFAARQKYGIQYVPNIITIFHKDNDIIFTTVSYPYEIGMSQKVYWTDKNVKDLFNKNINNFFQNNPDQFIINTYKIKSDNNIILEIKNEFERRDSNGNGILIDLFYYTADEDNKISAYAYELKAGGNLDTKNAPSNANEVKSLEIIFKFCENCVSKFATCYDGKGDGTPDGAIGNHLKREQISIGKEFWNEVLEEEVSYDDFIKIYKEAYSLAKVEEIVIGE